MQQPPMQYQQYPMPYQQPMQPMQYQPMQQYQQPMQSMPMPDAGWSTSTTVMVVSVVAIFIAAAIYLVYDWKKSQPIAPVDDESIPLYTGNTANSNTANSNTDNSNTATNSGTQSGNTSNSNTDNSEAARVEAQRLEAQRVEAARVAKLAEEKAAAEAQRVEAARVAAEEKAAAEKLTGYYSGYAMRGTIQVPIKRFPDHRIACLSTDGINCRTGMAAASIDYYNRSENADKVKPVVCNPADYINPTHWCALGIVEMPKKSMTVAQEQAAYRQIVENELEAQRVEAQRVEAARVAEIERQRIAAEEEAFRIAEAKRIADAKVAGYYSGYAYRQDINIPLRRMPDHNVACLSLDGVTCQVSMPEEKVTFYNNPANAALVKPVICNPFTYANKDHWCNRGVRAMPRPGVSPEQEFTAANIMAEQQRIIIQNLNNAFAGFRF